MNKVAILTSSRADYGIYRPLIKILDKNSEFDITLVVFGIHLLKKYGYTIDEIINDSFTKIHKIQGIQNEKSIFSSISDYGELIKNFSKYWKKNKYDLVFVLGDRIEMSAAVQSIIPTQTKIAHIHGGEISSGSIDNIYRYQISLASDLHFVSTENSKKILSKYITEKSIFNVGSLSLDNLSEENIPDWITIKENFKFSFDEFCLITFHSETVNITNNIEYIRILKDTLLDLSKKIHLLITYPNIDNGGNLYIKMYHEIKKINPSKITLIKSLGKLNYFGCMKVARFILGNSSSGIIESASFGKFFINVGNRQKGRFRNKNTIDVKFNRNQILNQCYAIMKSHKYDGNNIYYKKNTALSIMSKLKIFFNK